MSAYECECGSAWNSQTARDECRIIDAAEDRDARKQHVSPKAMRPMRDWQED